MKKVGVILILISTVMFAMSACGNQTETPVQKEEVLSDEEEVVTGGAVAKTTVDRVTSDNIKKSKLSTVISQEKDAKWEKELSKKENTFEHPKVSLNPYGNSPLTALVFFRTEDKLSLRYTVKGTKKEYNIVEELGERTSFRVPVVGLYPDRKNKVVLELMKGDTVVKKRTITIQTKPLPAKMKDVVKVEKHTKKTAYPLTIISGQNTPYPFAYDEAGSVRWYLTVHTSNYGVFPLSNQRFILQPEQSFITTEEKAHTTEMVEMDYLGRSFRIMYTKKGYHHEVIEKTPGGNLLICSSSIRGHVEDTVQELDRKTGRIIKTLDMKDIFDDTYIDKIDWAHLNTASYNEKNGCVILSPRNVHSGIKVDWKTGKLKWILCNPEFFKGTKQESKVLKPIGTIKWHYQQHSVYEMPYDLDGNPDTIHVMMFDNHWQTMRKVSFFDNDPNSYVSVYTINEKKMTVKQEHIYAGVKSKITSNCAYAHEAGRMFSFGGYLDPLIQGRRGMVYEYDYDSERVLNQYSTRYYFYRGYEMKLNAEDMSKRMIESGNQVSGVLQAPSETKEKEIPTEKLSDKKVSFKLRGNVLYMRTTDHAILRVRFAGKKNYQIDYSAAGETGESKYLKTWYSIAIPVGKLQKGSYQVLVEYQGDWYKTGSSFQVN